MSLKDIASKVISGTPCGTVCGTPVPESYKVSQALGTVESGINTSLIAENSNCPTVPGTGCGTVGTLLKSGTVRGTPSGTLTLDELLTWYQSNRLTLNPSEDLFGYRNSKLSEPVDLVDLILKEKPDYWMRTNGDLEHCLQIIRRHARGQQGALI